MKLDQKYSGNVYILSSDDYAASRAVIYGMPMDYTVSFRPGSRFGPARIREVSIGLEEYSPYLDKSLEEITYFDAGDLLLPFGNAGRSLEIIGEYVRGLLADGKFPFGLGGEHLVSWPVIQEVYAKYPDLALIHIDAHADLREHYEGEPLSHSTPVRKAAALMGGKNIYQFGIRSGSREEFQFGRENINFYPFEVLEPLKKVLPELAGRPVYLTIDIDVLDPMCAPGTGTAEAGGITSKELLAAIHAMAASGLNFVGADIVEVAPAYDPTEQTQIVASKLIREMLLGLVK
ncbi:MULTISPECIES: agmatinase [unclassified Paenibacillus]|uniref:agmatinase n=1 Tax=unclassified Paenibacillus TaxID=185978 RepID=UPI001AE5432F|nr:MULTISPECIES: agmatinase [unclassified Paenibacillus]MBP1153435.1 agmatinase [Paenibacillus sp. PvP091]MBP1171182.1 agmatinase [Paenibacillus sp. PvR098]MBP2442210.1 agmatinase [Paenibacillus sp. PvP052]